MPLPRDVTRIAHLQGIDMILEVLHRTTGMRIALVAHVTEESWTAAAVSDRANFGLRPGDALPLHTTY